MASNRPPIYPENARRRGIQGRVVLQVSVSVEGAPVAVRVAESSGATSLDDAAVAAVRQWRFVPASQGSRPLPGTAEVPIVFRLEQ
jgi:protein TonB